MSKKYSITNMNGDTENDEKKCGLTDMNCLGQDVNSAYPKKDDKTSPDEWKISGSSAGKGKDSVEATPGDNIPDNNR